MSSTLHYLTVQDILWINLQITKKVQHFSYARLEEATYYQYAYGESNSLLPQAARFLSGFQRMRPFDAGNEATAFVAVLAFLLVNGQHLSLTDADGSRWFGETGQKASALLVIQQVAHTDHHSDDGHGPSVRDAVASVLAKYASTIRDLACSKAA